MAEIDAPELPPTEYDREVSPQRAVARRMPRGDPVRQIGDAAAGADQLDLGLIDARKLRRIVVGTPEHERPGKPERAGEDEDRRPAERHLQPRQQRRKKRKADELR